MSFIFVLLWMIFFHIVDDFVLQPICLSALKQKSYWQENAPDKQYERDYIWALIMHSFSWAFMIMLPVANFYHFNVGYEFTIMFIINVVVHAFVDNMKANWKVINLWADQFFHLAQILLTFLLVFM